jgi:predicted metal-dependent phosphoesterase TrpH
MSADLHIHSNLSDGTDSPEEIVYLAKAASLKTIALTDHDNLDGLTSAANAGVVAGVEVVPGIEFSTESNGNEIHILGYYIDAQNCQLNSILEKIQTDRVERIYKITQKLQALNVELVPEEVFKLSGEKAPGRPHVARALINKGIVANFKEAFSKYLDQRAPAYVPHYRLEPEEIVKLITESGGIAVYAHPAVSACDQIIPDLIVAGLRGLEVYYIGHKPHVITHYLSLAEKYGLLVVGGSDYHGSQSGRDVKLGDITIPDELVDNLRDEHLRRN